MKRSESWVSSIVKQSGLHNISTVPAVLSSGQRKRSAYPKKSKKDLGVFRVGTSIVGEGEVI